MSIELRKLRRARLHGKPIDREVQARDVLFIPESDLNQAGPLMVFVLEASDDQVALRFDALTPPAERFRTLPLKTLQELQAIYW